MLEDLQKGWAAALADYPFLDGNRACAMGSSFGGYMIYWIAGVWNEPWRCLISHAGTLDSRAYTSDIQWHADRQMGGTSLGQSRSRGAVQRDGPCRRMEGAAAGHARPGATSACPSTRGWPPSPWRSGAASPSELLYMPNENHIISGAQASIRWYEVVDAWLDRWTAP